MKKIQLMMVQALEATSKETLEISFGMEEFSLPLPLEIATLMPSLLSLVTLKAFLRMTLTTTLNNTSLIVLILPVMTFAMV